MPSVKMLGNMIELKNPTAMIDTIATCPKVSIEITAIGELANTVAAAQ